MAKLDGQRPKLVRIIEILNECTDENHGLTINELIKKLDAYNVPAERKSIYKDFECLADIGYTITSERRNRETFYTLKKRDKDLTIGELKILVDAVQSSKFISKNKSNELISKLSRFASQYQGEQLKRQVYLSDRVKTRNDGGFKNIDKIYNAINNDRQIFLSYLKWTEKKELVSRHGAKRYRLSPWAVTMSDENYYLVAYDHDEKKIKHFRIDKMDNIVVSEESGREGKDFFDSNNFGEYCTCHFGMFNGKKVFVTLLCQNDLAGVIIDRFGKDVSMMKSDENHFTVTVKIIMSAQFIGWVIGLGKGIKILAPEEAVEKMKETIAFLQEAYL